MIAKIKILIEVEAEYVRDVHEAVDAMHAHLNARGGGVVKARVRVPEPKKEACGTGCGCAQAASSSRGT